MLNNKQNLKNKLNKINSSRIYQCIICLQRVKKPVSCLICKKIICSQHINKIQSRCPYCRTSPYQFKIQETMEKIIEGIVENERQLQKSTKIYQCLIIGCKFQGNYVAMLKHRKKYHSQLTINQLLYDQNAKKNHQKRMALYQVLNRILLTKVQLTIAFFAAKNPKQTPPGELKKVPSFSQAKEMVMHTKICGHPQCKKLWITKWGSYIGGDGGQIDFPLSMCPTGRYLNQLIGWIYTDPKH